MAAGMKLTYFNAKGRAELTRLLLAQAQKDYIDFRINFEDWKHLKSLTHLGRIPILEVDGKGTLCESVAIARYVAREYDLYGETNWQAAICDMVLDSYVKVLEELVAYRFTAKTQRQKAAALATVDNSLHEFERLIVSFAKEPYVLGTQVSIADAAIYCITDLCRTFIHDFTHNAFPTVQKIAKGFAEIPSIASWLTSRPLTIN